MKDVYKKRIKLAISHSGRRPLSVKALAIRCKVKKRSQRAFFEALDELVLHGEILKRGNRFSTGRDGNIFKAKMDSLNKTFGFAVKLVDSERIFIPGRRLLGALKGDTILVRQTNKKSKEGLTEGEIIKILECGPSTFTGVVTSRKNGLFVLPDDLSDFEIPLTNEANIPVNDGDKVQCLVNYRGKRHSEHRAEITCVYGKANSAATCAAAILDEAGIPIDFSDSAKSEAAEIDRAGITNKDLESRLDLREEIIFTIDGEFAKDLDDAISIERNGDGYKLGVHIADISHYVKKGSAIDEEAYERGTSIYYANKVVPMLPKELSNGICSLNPNEDRLCFSALIDLNTDGKIISHKFEKTVIRSKIKGIYSEINSILDGKASDEIRQKYADVLDKIALMDELADILHKNKRMRGAPQLDTVEGLLTIDENDVPIDIRPYERGKSEIIIEELMLTANEAAAEFAKKMKIPFIYRVHEDPAPEKLASLKETLSKIGIPAKGIDDKTAAGTLADILDITRDSQYSSLISMLILRSMAKAVYSDIPKGHYGLVLKNYAHFTAPIRRYPDLCIHRIMSDYLTDRNKVRISNRYTKFVGEAANHSSQKELLSMQIERDCESSYKAELMGKFIGEEFDGVISGVTEHGIYVQLENTIEGLITLNSMPVGEYSYDTPIECTHINSGKIFRIGDAMRIKVTNVNINLGRIDFSIAD